MPAVDRQHKGRVALDGANPLVEAAWEAGATVLVGDAASADLLRRARVQRARQLFVVCGDDGVDAEVAVRASQLAAGRREGALECFVHIVNPQLCTLLRQREPALGKASSVQLGFFNVYESGARALPAQFPPCSPGESHARPPHMLLVGAGRMGLGVAEQFMCARRAAWAEAGERMRITIACAGSRSWRARAGLRCCWGRADARRLRVAR